MPEGNFAMAAKRRHWKEKDGRFWARISIPVALRPLFDGKTQLTTALGGDFRDADRKHATAVAGMQKQIDKAKRTLEPAFEEARFNRPQINTRPVDQDHAIWLHYAGILENDEQKRSTMPTKAELENEYEKCLQRIATNNADPDRGFTDTFNVSTDYELLSGARSFDENLRTRRLAALRRNLNAGDTSLVDAAVQRHLKSRNLYVENDAAEWHNLATKFMRAEIDALQRTLERDKGNFDDTPTDPVIKQPAIPIKDLSPVPLKKLFHDYIATRQAIGKHRDGGANWDSVILDLIKFLGHGDARRITRRNILDWRDFLMASGKAAKTVSDKHLAAIRAVLRWAFEDDLLLDNVAESVRQEVPRKVQTREKGYTTVEAVKVLKASLSYKPKISANPSNRESAHIAAAKTWVPLLCAFTGARVTEITQLRKQDVRQEDERWTIRITPDAGSVKTGQYRDVPLHRQVIALGFMNFVGVMKDGPLFHASKTSDKYVAG